MGIRRTRYNLLSVGIIALTAAVGISVWPRLPTEMAVHFSATGSPDNYVPRTVGVTLMPAVMLLLLLVFDWAARVDPPTDARSFAVVTVATVTLLATVQFVVLAWNLGYSLPFEFVFGGILLWTVLVAGYAVLRERGSSAV